MFLYKYFYIRPSWRYLWCFPSPSGQEGTVSNCTCVVFSDKIWKDLRQDLISFRGKHCHEKVGWNIIETWSSSCWPAEFIDKILVKESVIASHSVRKSLHHVLCYPACEDLEPVCWSLLQICSKNLEINLHLYFNLYHLTFRLKKVIRLLAAVCICSSLYFANSLERRNSVNS